MSIDQTIQEKKRLLSILRHWHKIEFFIPFDLKERAERSLNQGNALYLDALQGAKILENLKSSPLPFDKETGGFTLFIGVFEKAELLALCHDLFPSPQDPFSNQEDRERGDIEGETCFAELRLSAAGEPLFDDLQVSTLPWALGKSRKYGIEYLTWENFQSDWQDLQRLIFNFASDRKQKSNLREQTETAQFVAPEDAIQNETRTANPLSFDEIIALFTLLQDWADFSPKDHDRIAFAEMWLKEKSKKDSSEEKTVTSQKETARVFEQTSQTDEDHDEEEEEEEEESSAKSDETEIGILNSFYIEDIEKAIRQTMTEDVENLQRYVSSARMNVRINLFDDRGRKELISRLRPSKNVMGRWFDASDRFMSLMQQFAINSIFGELQEGGIFSVNGPPGTGKTTLLKEVIAENIVKRAEILAGLRNAYDAFSTENHPVSIAGAKFKSYKKLKKELTGFEMVVASSNNAAVENISKELPQRGALSGEWRKESTPEYLRSVAYKIAAQKTKNKLATLSDEETPWGLISCVLGNKKNRRSFLKKFSIKLPMNDKNKKQTETAEDIYTWVDNYKGISFEDARVAFLETLEIVKSHTLELELFADIHDKYQEVSSTEFLAKLHCNLARKENDVQSLGLKLENAQNSLKNIEREIRNFKEEERLLDRQAPSWLEKLFSTSRARRHKIKVSHNANQQQSLNTRKNNQEKLISTDIEPKLKIALEDAYTARQLIEKNNQRCEELKQKISNLHKKYPEIEIPHSVDDIEQNNFQKKGLWQTQSLAKLRSRLFRLALELHQAWLAEVAVSGQPLRRHLFMISTLLNNPEKTLLPNDILALWQSFFMIVPVVSTTFASFGRQFKPLGSGALGWVFIDEAGQATPQSAVGAIMRAKRVVAVGDPRQIEPVFTVPEHLINAICEQSPDTAGGTFAPNRTSVQELSDNGNTLGAVVTDSQGQDVWIGSPLRVHRRCIDPMFSLANKIAYEDKMVFGKKDHSSSKDLLIKQPSCWIDIRGEVENKQTVEPQNHFVAGILLELLDKQKLPDGVFVITPFKEIKRDLLNRIKTKIRNRPEIKTAEVEKWCRKNIGTVHTFQGKEADIVIFVLGCSRASPGGAQWASSKPNLLNVALTRAKQRVYLVGDKSLWSGLPSFNVAAEALQTISGTEFLKNLHQNNGKAPETEIV